jgi:hypothetical protein
VRASPAFAGRATRPNWRETGRKGRKANFGGVQPISDQRANSPKSTTRLDPRPHRAFMPG